MGQYLENIAEIFGIVGVIGGFFAWLLTGVLSNKKDTITNAINIQHLNEKLKALEDEVNENRRDFEHWKDGKNKSS